MAPEILAGCPYDFKADIWSLGVTFFEMLTGKYPFKGQNRTEIYEAIKNRPYHNTQLYNLSKDCQDFLAQCL